jgi:hypothetical protein
MLHGAVGGAFGDATNQELSEAFPPKPRHLAQKQYGLQIAERRGKIFGELSSPIDFDYHRTNDGPRGGDGPAPQGSPLCEPER